MSCAPTLARLPCDRSGIATVGAKYTGGASLTLKAGSAAQLPQLQAGEVLFLEVIGKACGGCATFRVTNIVGETLTVDDVPGVCLPAGVALRYTATHPEAVKLLAAEVPFEAESPLVWNCQSRTLSVDCTALKAMMNTPCGA
jgi:hypothetical protein